MLSLRVEAAASEHVSDQSLLNLLPFNIIA